MVIPMDTPCMVPDRAHSTFTCFLAALMYVWSGTPFAHSLFTEPDACWSPILEVYNAYTKHCSCCKRYHMCVYVCICIIMYICICICVYMYVYVYVYIYVLCICVYMDVPLVNFK